MNGEPLRVLVIDDEEFHAEAVAESLRRVGYECVIATSGAAGARKIEEEDFDVILTDLRMEGRDGLDILRKAKQELPDSEVILITGHGDVKTAVEAMRQGAAHYLLKPVDLAELRAMVDKSAERLRLARANRELKRQIDEKFGFEGVVGSSPKMREVIAKLQAVAPTSATVRNQGETGTGKELVAKAIHTNSPRKNKPFVPMNCTALNENLLEDELFGHEAGSFTGADRARKGRFEHAHGGTLFLDEVGDMPPALQAKLLRVLENQEVFRIGSNEPIRVNVRLISATNRDLEAAVAEGSFRPDLYHRLKVVTVKLPPLRERREDIPLLVAHFIKEFNQRHGKHVTGVAEPIRKALATYDWPGNVRELRNLIESMVVLDQDGILGPDDVQEGDTLRRLHLAGPTSPGPDSLVGRPLTEVERYYVEQALLLTNNNREEAARMLGIGERTLYRVMQDWKLQDRIRQALAANQGDVAAAAKQLGLTEMTLLRKIKKWGIQVGTR
ncbi:MAG: sigma 54-interacting transcriptional regulator [Gemmataceae bacterium]|nr:sigma 54-interacting transcriptional regulator [Gemmataceae bacterium]MDW8264649.1 sigma 54-interacting transcriptional regulator [Gemmataceae bacterium]